MWTNSTYFNKTIQLSGRIYIKFPRLHGFALGNILGQLLLLLCILFYLAWWIISCRPGSPDRSGGAGALVEIYLLYELYIIFT